MNAAPGGGDLTHMKFGPTSDVVNGVQLEIDGWTTAWTGLSAAIRAEERAVQTGFDDISVAFREKYNAAEPELTQRAGDVGAKVNEALAVARAGLATYQATYGVATAKLQPPG
ncbi:hypothetical protein OG474_20415 [Kribbella sp. NBC_01505]|uniref:hypothetical protein n=1 Tax=Kribbella sp. NBC_01505 TaxID=2903580 RepID=UPI00386B93E2